MINSNDSASDTLTVICKIATGPRPGILLQKSVVSNDKHNMSTARRDGILCICVPRESDKWDPQRRSLDSSLEHYLGVSTRRPASVEWLEIRRIVAARQECVLCPRQPA
ncbi:hypothetical protein ANTQUA_LOCUS1273 [Anthophora quadrimaculata]